MKRFIILWLFLAIPALAQTPGPAVVAEMRKLDFLVGEWQGEGWMELGPGQRRSSKVKEAVQSKVGGHALLIEGLGKAKLPGKDEEVAVHEAFALVWYDSAAKRFRMLAYRVNGGAVDADITVGDKSLIWGFRDPRAGQIRFTIKLDEQGRWFEIGEFSMDGKDWRKFFEMTLQRVR